MSNPVPQKIVLKSTTSISLNDRFSSITPIPRAQQTVVGKITAQEVQASARNRRLAQQMANRPTVVAALDQRQRSLQQRLGVKARLKLAEGRGQGYMRGRGAVRGGNVMYINYGTPRVLRGGARGRFQSRGRLQGFQQRGRGQMHRGQVNQARGARSRGRGAGGTRFYNQTPARGSYSRGRRGQGRGRFQRGQAQRGFGRGRGGRGRGGQGQVVSKEQLDTQLDKYMSKTKLALDAELDAYMASTDD